MISSVNHNLEARRRDVRFGFRRKCCGAWVQVEYGTAISASLPGAPKAPPSPPAAAASSSVVLKPTTTVEAMSGATQPLEAALLGRDGAAAGPTSVV